MKYDVMQNTHFFFTTTPLPCPYLEGRLEQRMVTELFGINATDLGNRLSLAGFRRSHTICYTPICENCSACVSVRIPVNDFAPNKNQRRTLSKNTHLTAEECPPMATPEQYALFRSYLDARHMDGDMASMEENDYTAMIEDTPVQSSVVEFRDEHLNLVAGALIDRFDDGLSAIYSFFDATLKKQSLGTFMVLWLIEYTKQQGLDYLYLGYWVQDSPKMQYKCNYTPLEGFTPNGWKLLKNKS